MPILSFKGRLGRLFMNIIFQFYQIPCSFVQFPVLSLNNTRSGLDIVFDANKESWGKSRREFRGKYLKRPLNGGIGMLYNYGPGVRGKNARRLLVQSENTRTFVRTWEL